MFNLFKRAKQPKTEITGASWTDEAGKTVTVKFDPPHTRIYHAVADVDQRRNLPGR